MNFFLDSFLKEDYYLGKTVKLDVMLAFLLDPSFYYNHIKGLRLNVYNIEKFPDFYNTKILKEIIQNPSMNPFRVFLQLKQNIIQI